MAARPSLRSGAGPSHAEAAAGTTRPDRLNWAPGRRRLARRREICVVPRTRREGTARETARVWRSAVPGGSLSPLLGVRMAARPSLRSGAGPSHAEAAAGTTRPDRLNWAPGARRLERTREICVVPRPRRGGTALVWRSVVPRGSLSPLARWNGRALECVAPLGYRFARAIHADIAASTASSIVVVIVKYSFWRPNCACT